MGRQYLCPECRAVLNPQGKVVFVIEQQSCRGLALLSPKLGDYAVTVGDGVPVVAGSAYRFRCPVCHADLTSPLDPNLARVLSRTPSGTVAEVAFSRIAGEHATFLRGVRGVRRFGEHARRYEHLNFFGAGQGPQE